MSRDKVTHQGPSWDDLDASGSSSTKSVYVKFTPIAAGGRHWMLRISRLSNFRSGSMFMFDGETPQGKKVELYGYGRHRSTDPATYEIVTRS